jgi:hypothetical protein
MCMPRYLTVSYHSYHGVVNLNGIIDNNNVSCLRLAKPEGSMMYT